MLLSISLLVVVIANGLLEIVVRSMLLWSALKRRNGGHVANFARPPRATAPAAAPFVSAHIAIHNEPPELVIATLEAVAASSFPEFEVIVVDNNTEDPAIWRPVEAASRALGERFRFLHFDRLAGAKAGALNVALEAMDARASHVAIIDADYQVAPDFFASALAALAASGVDYVQFPQAYRGVSACGRGVEQELGDYFACFESGAGRPGSMLPTGTLSLFTAAALRAVGGWSARTITEDAEIGVRLQAAGRRGLWVAERAGHGLLPVDYRGLARQRSRWASGNMQVLAGVIARRGMRLSAGERINLVAQLTAWISLWALPAAALVLVAMLPSMPLAAAIGAAAAATILLSSLLTFIRMAWLVEPQAGKTRVQIAAFAAKLALGWTSAFAWMPALFAARLRFHRTPKTLEGDRRDPLAGLLAVSLLFGALALRFAALGAPIQSAACGLLAAIWGCARRVDRSLRRTAALNAAANVAG